MSTDRPDQLDARQLDQLAPPLRRYLLRLCGWCSTSLAGRRCDAWYCSTAHRCRAWRDRRRTGTPRPVWPSPNLTDPHTEKGPTP